MRDQVTAKPEYRRKTRTHIHYSASLELTVPKAQGSADSGATCSNTLFPGVSYCINRPNFLYLSVILTRLNWGDGGKAQCFVRPPGLYGAEYFITRSCSSFEGRRGHCFFGKLSFGSMNLYILCSKGKIPVRACKDSNFGRLFSSQ